MKTILKISTTITVLILLTIVDIPLLPVELVPEAEAIFGVRRRVAGRTAVVAYSAGAASATEASRAASTPQQQAASVPQQQPAPSQPVSTVPVGTVVETLPGKCEAVTVGNTKYQDCGGSFYKAAFQGNNLVYVVVDRPI